MYNSLVVQNFSAAAYIVRNRLGTREQHHCFYVTSAAAGEGKTWDIRAEDISYWETRDYVKRVMGNYWIYQEIYDGL